MNRKIINMIFNYCFAQKGRREGVGGEFHFCPSRSVKVTPAALFLEGVMGELRNERI